MTKRRRGWDEADHPRNGEGEFTDSWAQAVSSRLPGQQEALSGEHDRRQQIQSVTCPTCHAGPGRRCTKPSGGPLSTPEPYHTARLGAARRAHPGLV